MYSIKVEGKKFMWDGEDYKDEASAREVALQYQREGFETYILKKEEGIWHVFTRRVVTEVVVEGQPPV